MRLPLILILIFAFFGPLSGQTLSGIVTNESGQGLQEVNILNYTTDHHTHSDQQGQFIFEHIHVGDTLLFSHVSYQRKEVVVQDLDEPLWVSMSIKLTYLDEVVLSPQVDALDIITGIDIQNAPINSSQDILRKVPGLFIGQHAGGGKAEQIFLRGFDVDHGTDVALSVDGIPVNMVSHAHGQGYADLHFVIPETIEKVDFGKGPYYESKGNFNTAGYVDYVTKHRLDNSVVKLELGQFDTYRLLGMFNLVDLSKHQAYIATEYLSSDGPFDSPQNFNRVNLMAKYTATLTPRDLFSFTASHFSSKWDASGQIPQRAVDSGMIGRFGAIDDTEGGNTSRSNFILSHERSIDDKTSLKSTAFLSLYDFELYSNFTFFLEDPLNGDQIRQKEKRSIYGLQSEYKHNFIAGNWDGSWQAGVLLRHDQSLENELSHTANRQEVLSRIQFGDIYETNLGGYLGASFNYRKWSFNPSLRLDYFDFQYNDALVADYQTLSESKVIVSPKLNITFNQSETLQFYLKGGKGFHSNDTRVVVAQNGEDILPAVYGFDAGLIWKPMPEMLLNAAYWYLYSEQEFVYVGDAGIVEPSGRSRRQGGELSFRYQPIKWFYFNLDANYTFARALEEEKGQDYIPLAPDFTLVAGINVLHDSGFDGGINLRYLDSRPANEDNSIVAEGYTVVDFNLGYRWKKLKLGIQIQNLFDVEWNETQFATESRLQNEPAPVEEIHFTPGTPFFIKGIIGVSF